MTSQHLCCALIADEEKKASLLLTYPTLITPTLVTPNPTNAHPKSQRDTPQMSYAATYGATFGATFGATYAATYGATYAAPCGATYAATYGTTYGTTYGASCTVTHTTCNTSSIAVNSSSTPPMHTAHSQTQCTNYNKMGLHATRHPSLSGPPPHHHPYCLLPLPAIGYEEGHKSEAVSKLVWHRVRSCHLESKYLGMNSSRIS